VWQFNTQGESVKSIIKWLAYKGLKFWLLLWCGAGRSLKEKNWEKKIKLEF